MKNSSEGKSYPLFIKNFNGDLVPVNSPIQKRNLGSDSGKYYFDLVCGSVPITNRIEGATESAAKSAAQAVLDSLTIAMSESKVNEGVVTVNIADL